MARKLATIDSLPNLFDESRGPIYAIDAERRVVYCNPALSAWLDITKARIIGRTVEYHSESTNDAEGRNAAPLADLCPPPRAFAGEPCKGTLSCMGREGRLVHRRAEFLPLDMSRGGTRKLGDDQTASRHHAVLVLLAGVDMSAQEVATELSGEPTGDELHHTIRRFRRAQAARYSIASLLGQSAAMQKVRAQVSAAATSGAHTLVCSPRGAGRGHVARAIHYSAASEAEARLVPVACETLTDDVLRRALESVRMGPEEAMHRPTLLLENIDRMPAVHQSILNDAIRQKGFSARIIATCGRHTPSAATEPEPDKNESPSENGEAEGERSVPATIEPSLFDAISIITIQIPPLADRLEDLPILAQYFLETCNRGNDKQIGSIRSDAITRLALYSWPGELVQLRETIIAAHRACKTHEITPADLSELVHHASQAATRARRQPERIVLDELLASIEKEAIVRALAQTGGNKSEAATMLGMTRPRLYRRLVQLGLVGEVSDEQDEEQPEFIEREPTE